MPPLALADDESSAARVVDPPLADFESLVAARVSAVESVGAALLPFVSTANAEGVLCALAALAATMAATPVLWEVNAANVRMIAEIFMVIIYCNERRGRDGVVIVVE